MNKQITLTYKDLRDVLLDIINPPAYGAWDEDKVATIVTRAEEILDMFFTDDNTTEPPVIEYKVARRVLYQVKGTYEDAIYTAQRRAGEMMNALRGV